MSIPQDLKYRLNISVNRPWRLPAYHYPALRRYLAVGLMMLIGLPIHAEELRLLTWSGYAPDEVVRQFQQETGIKVLVTQSNNEEMVAKLRETGGAGFDLVQPSQDRVKSAQQQYNIYQPIDLSKVDLSRFAGSMLASTNRNTAIDSEIFGLPHIWGTSGLIVHETVVEVVKDYADLCKPELNGKVSFRLKRPILIGFAFAMGEDPFKAYASPSDYEKILKKVGAQLISCRSNIHKYWDTSDQLISMIGSGQIAAAEGWDADGWKLHNQDPKIHYIAPRSGALGWIDTFAVPRKAKAIKAAYQWINFVMRPDIAAKITQSSGYFTAAKGAEEYLDSRVKENLTASFSEAAIENIKWYPPIPPGLEALETKILNRVRAAP